MCEEEGGGDRVTVPQNTKVLVWEERGFGKEEGRKYTLRTAFSLASASFLACFAWFSFLIQSSRDVRRKSRRKLKVGRTGECHLGSASASPVRTYVSSWLFPENSHTNEHKHTEYIAQTRRRTHHRARNDYSRGKGGGEGEI